MGYSRFPMSPRAPSSSQFHRRSLASQEFSGTLQSGEAYVTPLIMLVIPTQVTEVHVEGLTPEELADVQIKEQEKQRVFGVIPNFYVSYEPNAAPLTAKHKFGLAWKSASDPSHACRGWGTGGDWPGRRSLERVRTGSARIRKALRRKLRQCFCRNVYRRRGNAFGSQAGSTLLLQRKR